ncbi:MAG TPA: lysoplasmalogenase [Rhizobiales bacterium]|nr:lysoplasmalogenase [Hyphomicrobiales bacterium]
MMPFPGGIEETANATLLFSFAAGVFYLFIVEARVSLARSAIKTASILLLAMLSAVRGGPLLLTGGLLLSSAGDAFLSRNGERAFMGGLASFLVAHLCYIALFSLAGGGFALLLVDLWRTVVAVLMAGSVLAMMIVLLPRVGPSLRLPVLVYGLAILTMGLSALTLDNYWILAGAILFMASDAILATERFLTSGVSPNRLAMRIAVWVAYYAAQLTITLGVLLA